MHDDKKHYVTTTRKVGNTIVTPADQDYPLKVSVGNWYTAIPLT